MAYVCVGCSVRAVIACPPAVAVKGVGHEHPVRLLQLLFVGLPEVSVCGLMPPCPLVALSLAFVVLV